MLPTKRTPYRPHHSATIVRRKPSLDFSVTGLVYCSMMMFMGLAAINSQANLLFGVFGLMIGILLVSGVISKLVLRRITARRVLPEHAIVGQPVTLLYEIDNAKRFWPSLSVTLAELDGAEAFTKQPQAYMLHAAARATARVPAELIPKRRGLHHLDRHQLITSFPFGFIKRAVERSQPDSLLIHPAIAEVSPRVLAMCRSAEKSGATMRPRRGGTDEFYGVKEFRTGENPRWIYWRRSARTGTLVSKEMSHVSPPRLVLLVDSHLGDRTTAAHAAVEKVIAMAASLASHALNGGLPVGLILWSDGWIHLPPNRGKRHCRDLLGILARVNINQRIPARALLDHSYQQLKSGTTGVLLTSRSVSLSLGEQSRGGMVVFSPDMAQIDELFKFGKTVDFNRSMPADQQPMID